MPPAIRLTIHTLAAVAEPEAKMIGERTKGALAQSKKKLGGFRPNGKAPSKEHTMKSVEVRRATANAHAKDLAPGLTDSGKRRAHAYGEVPPQMNEKGVPAPPGDIWWTMLWPGSPDQ